MNVAPVYNSRIKFFIKVPFDLSLVEKIKISSGKLVFKSKIQEKDLEGKKRIYLKLDPLVSGYQDDWYTKLKIPSEKIKKIAITITNSLGSETQLVIDAPSIDPGHCYQLLIQADGSQVKASLIDESLIMRKDHLSDVVQKMETVSMILMANHLQKFMKDYRDTFFVMRAAIHGSDEEPVLLAREAILFSLQRMPDEVFQKLLEKKEGHDFSWETLNEILKIAYIGAMLYRNIELHFKIDLNSEENQLLQRSVISHIKGFYSEVQSIAEG